MPGFYLPDFPIWDLLSLWIIKAWLTYPRELPPFGIYFLLPVSLSSFRETRFCSVKFLLRVQLFWVPVSTRVSTMWPEPDPSAHFSCTKAASRDARRFFIAAVASANEGSPWLHSLMRRIGLDSALNSVPGAAPPPYLFGLCLHHHLVVGGPYRQDGPSCAIVRLPMRLWSWSCSKCSTSVEFLLVALVSDRGPGFASLFRKDFCSRLGVTASLLSGAWFHRIPLSGQSSG